MGTVALTVALGRPHSLQQVEQGVTAGPLKLRIDEDAALEIAVPAVTVTVGGSG